MKQIVLMSWWNPMGSTQIPDIPWRKCHTLGCPWPARRSYFARYIHEFYTHNYYRLPHRCTSPTVTTLYMCVVLLQSYVWYWNLMWGVLQYCIIQHVCCTLFSFHFSILSLPISHTYTLYLPQLSLPFPYIYSLPPTTLSNSNPLFLVILHDCNECRLGNEITHRRKLIQYW